MAMTHEELKKEIFEFLEEKYQIDGIDEVEEDTKYEPWGVETTIWFKVNTSLFHKTIDLPLATILELDN